MDKSVEKTVTLFRKSYAGRLTADERAEMVRLLEDENMRRLYEEVGDDEYLIGEFRRYAGWEPVRGYRKFRKNMRRQSIRKNLIRLSVAASLLMALGAVWLLVERDRPEDCVKMAETVVEPGTCRAFLQLSSGERIVLEKSGQRDLQETAGSIRIDSGKVVYSAPVASQPENVVYNTLSIPNGGEYRLLLADGSAVHLNAGSELRYPVAFAAAERKVYLKGEAWFEVAKDSEHPFIVHISRGAIEVLGTGFNVRDYREEQKTVTTLVQGKVVYRPERQPGREIMLEPGFQIKDEEGGSLQPRKVDVILYTGWKDGKYVFENATLEEIMQVLSRWYDIAVFYKREEVKKLHFTGDLERYKTINDFLEFMEIGGNVRFSIKGKTVLIE